MADQLLIGWTRYEKLRKLRPFEFQDLHARNLQGERFDDMVDELPEPSTPVPSSMNPSSMQEDFEFLAKRFNVPLGKTFGGKFLNSGVQAAWEDWQARAALSTQPQQAGWRPIETAPKDGTHIIVSWPMRSLDEDDRPTGEITTRSTLITWWDGNSWVEPDYLGASGSWYGDDDAFTDEPDLWQPAPLPPVPGQEGVVR